MPNKTTAQAVIDNQKMLDHFDKWIHIAVVLGYVAIEAGVDPAEVDRILKADKATVDRLLVQKFRERSG